MSRLWHVRRACRNLVLRKMAGAIGPENVLSLELGEKRWAQRARCVNLVYHVIFDIIVDEKPSDLCVCKNCDQYLAYEESGMYCISRRFDNH